MMNQISLRIAIAMLPALVLVLTLFGLATAMREGEVIQLEMQRDADAVAQSIAQLIPPTASLEQTRARLEIIDERFEHLSIDLVEGPAASLGPDPEQRPPRVVGYAGIQGGGGDSAQPRAWIVVTEPLAERDAFVRRALLADVVGIVVATLVASAFAMAVGRMLVQKRVLQLAARLSEVGRGSYPDTPLRLGRDELGRLGEAVESMTRQLREARDQASREGAGRRRAQLQLRRADRLAAIGRTVAVFAHEVGTPLAVISGRAERLARPNQPESVRSDASIIGAQADRIAAFVRRLLDYARHDDGFELSPTRIATVLELALPLATERARSVGVTLSASTPEPDLEVEGDQQALIQVLTNLISNAVDASPRGGEVEVSARVVRCDVGTQRDLTPYHIHVCVDDAGQGVPPELRERVFDPFFSTKDAENGTGLGLAIVAEIVQDHGGCVSIEDRPGGGCRAIVHLPLGGVHA